MNRKTRYFVQAASLLAAAGTIAPVPAGHGGAGFADDIVAIALVPEIAHLMELPLRPSCNQTCADCPGSKHSAKAGSGHQSVGAHTPSLHECNEVAGHAYCDDGTHEPCLAQQEDRDAQARHAVFAALAEADFPVLAELLATRPDLVWLNRERSAIQVLSCTGGMFAHLPVQVTYRTAQ